MRPLTLKMSAFGSYKNETLIKLDKLGDHGIFLICGDTGSGKTTIFDAIAFALFGEASGSSRESGMFNSELAREGAPTWAELTFAYAGREYRVRRSTDHMEFKKRGKGMTEVKGEAELYMPDGGVIVSKRAVTEKVTEIIGMNRAQFAQIAMIAQGEFQKLLTAPTDERSALFSKLLKTKNYVELQDMLRDRCARQSSLCAELKRAAEQSLEGAQFAEGAAWREKLDSAGKADLASAAEILLAAIDEDEKELEKLSGEIAEAERQIAGINKALGKAENTEKLRANLEKARGELASAEKALDSAKASFAVEEAKEPERAALAETAAAQKAELPAYEELEKLSSAAAELTASLAAADHAVKELREKRVSLLNETARLKAEKESLSNAAAGKAALEAEVKSAEAAQTELRQLNSDAAALKRQKKLLAEKQDAHTQAAKKRLDGAAALAKELFKIKADEISAAEKAEALKEADVRLEREKGRLITLRSEAEQLTELSARMADENELSAKLKAKQNEFLKAQKSFAAARGAYEKMQEAFLCAQAGVIAGSLKEGEPCPVCGALSHPSPAGLPADVPGEDEIKKAKQKADKAEKKFSEESAASGECSAALKEKITERENAAAKIFGLPLPEDLAQAVRCKSAENESMREECESAIKAAEADSKAGKRAANEVADLRALAEKKTAAAEAASKADAVINSDEEAEINKLSGAVQTAEGLFTQRCLQIFPDAAAEDAKARAAAAEKENAAHIERLEESLIKAAEKAAREKELGSVIPQKEKETEATTDALHEEEKAFAEKSQRAASNKEQIEALASKLKYADGQIAAAELKKSVAALDKMKQAYEESRNKMTECATIQSSADGRVKGLEKELEGAAAEDDAKNLRARYADASSNKNALTEQRNAAETRVSVNIRTSAQLAEKTAALAAAEKELQMIKPLSDTANGTLNGKPKITLETWVQTAWFDRILERANVRLMKMSGGQYELKRREEKGQNQKGKIGLDIDVADHYGGKRRDVKTLSGGESFMASLSLALGLSDEVQYMAGGVRLDTLFIDEGFGSLDDETLEKAMRVLAELSGGSRLIGIISHVAALKERIDRQIVVTKDRTEGSRAEIRV